MNFLSLGTKQFAKLITAALSRGDHTDKHQVFHAPFDHLEVHCTLNALSLQCVVLEINDASRQVEAVVREVRQNRVGFMIVACVPDGGDLRRFALEAGVDIVIPRKTGLRELELSLLSATRVAATNMMDVVCIDGLVIDLTRRSVHYRDRRLLLSKREFQILEMLIIKNGEPVSKTRLLDQIYGLDEAPSPKIIDVFVCKLRKKLAAAGWDTGYIKTCWGEGYSLVATSTNALDVAA